MPSPASAVDPRAAARAARCELARRRLGFFFQAIEIPGAPIGEGESEAVKPVETGLAAHHRLLVSKLEAVERGEIRRLMVFMPAALIHLFDACPWTPRIPRRAIVLSGKLPRRRLTRCRGSQAR